MDRTELTRLRAELEDVRAREAKAQELATQLATCHSQREVVAEAEARKHKTEFTSLCTELEKVRACHAASREKVQADQKELTALRAEIQNVRESLAATEAEARADRKELTRVCAELEDVRAREIARLPASEAGSMELARLRVLFEDGRVLEAAAKTEAQRYKAEADSLSVEKGELLAQNISLHEQILAIRRDQARQLLAEPTANPATVTVKTEYVWPEAIATSSRVL
jgi:chromosome segregation ATPase